MANRTPIVFATYPMIAGPDKAGMIFNLVFFISITSVLLQGTTLLLVAGWLRVTEPRVATDKGFAEATPVSNEMKEVILTKESRSVSKKIVDLHFPSSTYIISITRKDQFIQPTGSDKLQAGDRLFDFVK